MGFFEEIWNDVNLDDIDKLGYTQDTKLDMVSRYENEDIQKIYFVDKDRNYPLRFFNIIYNADFNDYENFTQSNFNIIPKVELSKIEFDGYTGGELQTGMTCYSYQQYKKYGAETSFSEVSDMIPISKTITKDSISDVYGSDLEEDCGIGIKIKITNLDSSYHRIRILAFDFKDKYSNPTIRVIFEGDTNNNELYIVDNGGSLGTYDLSMFRIFNQFFIKPKVLATKNNILFAGNIKEEYFDLDKYLEESDDSYNNNLLTTDADNNIKFYDSRIYRFKKDLPRADELGDIPLNDAILYPGEFSVDESIFADVDENPGGSN